jgi:glycosyltransferase involved in cell wall biosynthesis
MLAILTIAGLSPESGGPSRSVPALAQALVEAGVEVQILSLDFGSRESPPLLPDTAQVRTHLIPCRGPRQVPSLWTRRFARQLDACVRTAPALVIHDTGAWLPTNHVAASTARRARVPLVVSPRGMLAAWSLGHKAWRKRIAWRLYQRRDLQIAAVLHATSRSEADEFRALGLTNPIALVPNGVEVPRLPPRSLSADSKTRTVLFLSRLHPKKGLEHLIDAWRELKPVGWRLLLAGPADDRYAAQIKFRIQHAGIVADVQWVGSVDGAAKWELYRSSDVFVLPSYNENFGLVVAEALACGVPVITTQTAPWEGLLCHNCGWWIPTGTGALTTALREAMQLSDAQRQAMGERGQRWIDAHFSWASVGRQMAAVYGWVLGRGPRPEWVSS